VDERLLSRALSVRSEPGLALDVGNLYPATPKLLARRGWGVVCADLVYDVCRQVREVADAESLPLFAVQCDGAALPFRQGGFDLVTDLVTSVVTQDARRLIVEEIRMLKPGALYILVTNNRWTRGGQYNLKRQKAAGGRHPRWGYFSPLSPLDLWALTWKYGLRMISMDSEGHSIGHTGLWLYCLGRLFPFVKRISGWRLGVAYVAPPED